jgi:predicted TPR repeat methyltransferase
LAISPTPQRPPLIIRPLMSSEFDQFADTYRSDMVRAISFCRSDPEFFTKIKADDILATAADIVPLNQLRMLDVGCGVGETDRFLVPHVAELHGVDVSADSIDRACQNNPKAHYLAYDGQQLP